MSFYEFKNLNYVSRSSRFQCIYIILPLAGAIPPFHYQNAEVSQIWIIILYTPGYNEIPCEINSIHRLMMSKKSRMAKIIVQSKVVQKDITVQ